ncbi:ABC transporter permease [Phycicoccus sp. BSK3Z-2]|uniref:ABC transporter permease n=1 Tax=Phycicoccus avicenniae TaxID=2828860 RepID=A0A941DA23_9MICO|nr:ABC transporter permease [Phycicoccus avicenniae]MBR7744301.1 ABC transporter permease [Phycicoccus avicenniae]
MIGVELRKLLGRPRTWVSIGLLCLLPVVVAVFLAVTGIAPRPGQGPTLLSAVLGNGALFPAAALGIVLPFFLPIAVAVQAGESVAGEAQSGTLRYLLVRPVGRTRLLVAKLVSVLAYTLLAVLSVAATGYLAGISLLGNSGQVTTTTLSGTTLTPADLAWRTGVMVLYIGWSMVGVASVALFLSTLTDSPLAAALGGLAVLVSSTVLVTLDAAGAVRDYLPTRYWLAWVDLFRDPVPWGDVTAGVLVQTGYVVVLLGAAWANFSTRDVTS